MSIERVIPRSQIPPPPRKASGAPLWDDDQFNRGSVSQLDSEVSLELLMIEYRSLLNKKIVSIYLTRVLCSLNIVYVIPRELTKSSLILLMIVGITLPAISAIESLLVNRKLNNIRDIMIHSGRGDKTAYIVARYGGYYNQLIESALRWELLLWPCLCIATVFTRMVQI